MLFGLVAATMKEAQGNLHDVSSGPNTHEKNNRQKRAAKDIESNPKIKKMRVNDTHEEIYRKFVMHSHKLKPAPKKNAIM